MIAKFSYFYCFDYSYQHNLGGYSEGTVSNIITVERKLMNGEDFQWFSNLVVELEYYKHAEITFRNISLVGTSVEVD